MPTPPLAGTLTLVTGGAGFIGSHLVDALVAARARVRVLDNFSSGSRDNLRHHGAAIELIEGDLRDAACCQAACRDARIVFHLAALGSVPRSMVDPATSVAVNVGGTANLLAAARDHGAERVIYASSSSVYGDAPTLPQREGQEGSPLSIYALSKAMGEQLAEIFGRCFGLLTIGLRYFNVYGPRQSPEGPYAAVVPRFFAAALGGVPMEIHGDGGQSRDFTFVGDAVQATLLAAGAPPAACGRAFNVAGGERLTVSELAAAIAATTGSAIGPRHVASRPGDVRDSKADLAAARELLGYEPRVLVAEGLRLTRDHLAPRR